MRKTNLILSVVFVGVVLALSTPVAAEEHEEEMRGHFEMMFQEVESRIEGDLDGIRNELNDPELSEDEQDAIEALIAAHQEIGEIAEKGLSMVDDAPLPELQEVEQSIREAEREIDVYWIRRERAMATRFLGMIEDESKQEELAEQLNSVFDEMIEISERRTELEKEKEEIAAEIEQAVMGIE